MKKRQKLNTFLMTLVIAVGSYGLTGCGADFTGADDGDDSGENGPGKLGVIFDGSLNSNWSTFDCCGATIPETVSDAENGTVLEFVGAINETNMGFVASDGIDLSDFGAGSTLNFDLKIINFPDTAGTDWAVKVQSNGGPYSTPAGEESAITVSFSDLPAVDTWQAFSFSLADMANDGLDLTAIDKIAISPNWGAAAGVVYYLDNVEFVDTDSVVDPDPDPDPTPDPDQIAEVTELLKGGDTSLWQIWGSTNVTASAEDRSDYDAVRPNSSIININTVGIDPADTTVSFAARDESADAIDVSAYESTGTLFFDIRLDSDTVVDDSWVIRLRSGAESADLMFITDSQEGVVPVAGDWTTYTYDLHKFVTANSTIDLSNITQVRVYPAHGTEIAVDYRIAKLGFYKTGAEAPAIPPADPVVITDVTKDLTTSWRTTGAADTTSYFYSVAGDAQEYRARFEINISDTAGNTTAQFEMVDAGAEIDVAAYSDTGVLSFDMKLRSSSAADAADYPWIVRLYGGGANAEVDLDGTLLVTDEFVNFTYDLSEFAGITMSSIDQIRIYPAYGTIATAHYDIANLRFYDIGAQ